MAYHTPMMHLSDKALTRLREGVKLPDLSGTRYRLLGEVARGGMGRRLCGGGRAFATPRRAKGTRSAGAGG